HENERIGEEMKENPSFHGENEGIRIMRFIAQGKLGRINRRSPQFRYNFRSVEFAKIAAVTSVSIRS
ncbi:hypothetical protein, partial [Paenibacillus sp. GCM10027626]|uniref:hypothetical protein n=1 Tax=Paenibacillus sp. GCM10027626 TaxID=3273411 RepID=UPI0036417E36